MILACQNIEKAFGEKVILKNVNFHIEEKEKVAVVGINGAGKTTLLKIILGEEEATNGQVVFAKDITVGYLSQHQDISFNNTVYAEMLATKQHIIDAEKELRELEVKMQHLSGDELDAVLGRYNTLQTKYDHENGYAYLSEITGVLKGLGFTESDYDRHINSLSGGQKMRIALGRLLLTRPDVIILDEPTNHLDMTSISWLESFLASYQGAVLIVSHDRYFIDKITTKIVEIDQGESQVYNGSYSFYSEERAKIREAKMKAYLNQQRDIKHQEAVIEKLKSFNREKSIKRAESREKMLDKIEVLDKPTEVRTDMRLMLTPVTESGEDVLLCDSISKSFGENLLFKDLTIDIKRGEHVALIGGNGTGKTTILKMINHMVSKDSGKINLGSRVKVGYYDQEHQLLSMDKTIFDEISDSFPDMNNTRIRNVLAAFLFTGDDVFKKIGDLSGGERGRVSLAKLMLSPANLLILDEPTNHLDIQSKEILETALKNYGGTLLYVSHDRYFINQTATRIIELRNKVLTNYKGNYDFYEANKDYLYNIQNGNNANAVNTEALTKTGFTQIKTVSDAFSDSQIKADSAISAGSSNAAAPATGKDAFLANKAEAAKRRKLENDIKKLEDAIEKLETTLAEIDEELCAPENASNSFKLNELTVKREETDAMLTQKYEEWEELSSML